MEMWTRSPGLRGIVGGYRGPFRRSLTREWLGAPFSEQASAAEAAAAATGAVADAYEREVEVAFGPAVSTRRPWRRRSVAALAAAVAAAGAWLLG
jgi:hypothetical protein